MLLRPPDILAKFWQELSHAPFPLQKYRDSRMNRSPQWKKKKREKIHATSACYSASTIWNQAFVFFMFPIFVVVASACVHYGSQRVLVQVVSNLCYCRW